MVFKRVFAPFVFGGVLAFILNVPTRAFEGLFKKVKNGNARRCLAILMTFLAIALILTGVFLLLIPELSATIQNLKPELYTFFTNTEAAVKNLIYKNGESVCNNQLLEKSPQHYKKAPSYSAIVKVVFFSQL